jgi:Zn-dependent peptidase ImmA (M78 family)
MQLGTSARLDPWDYAQELGVIVVGANQLELSQSCREQLLVRDKASWSGMTLKEDGVVLVVVNSAHARQRQCSTLMHELAHLILDHIPAEVTVAPSGLLLLSDYSAEQEEEADWLMGALLLPRCVLLSRRRAGASAEQIAQEFGVSADLCLWRLRMTGVEAQLRRAHGRWPG